MVDAVRPSRRSDHLGQRPRPPRLAGVALGNLSRPMKPQMDLDDEEEPMPQLAEDPRVRSDRVFDKLNLG